MVITGLVCGASSCVEGDVRVRVDGGTGAVIERATWRGSVRHGPWEIFYSDGEPKELGRFHEGVRIGFWRSWHPEGTVRSEGRFDGFGRRSGRWTEWHSNGQRSLAGVYVDGLRQGVWIHWDEAGRPFAEQSWERGTWVATNTLAPAPESE